MLPCSFHAVAVLLSKCGWCWCCMLLGGRPLQPRPAPPQACGGAGAAARRAILPLLQRRQAILPLLQRRLFHATTAFLLWLLAVAPGSWAASSLYPLPLLSGHHLCPPDPCSPAGHYLRSVK